MDPKRTTAIALLLSGTVLASTACSGGDDDSSGGGEAVLAVASDPGSLDPQAKVDDTNLLMGLLAYDTPVTLLDGGKLAPQVVTDWSREGNTWTLRVRKGVTCSDGTPVDGPTIAENINYIVDPKNGSAMVDVAVPAGAKATGRGLETIVKLAAPAPFFMENLAEMPIVCGKGLKDRGTLKTETSGSGPYVLADSTAGQSYTYEARDDVTWGPDGATVKDTDIPDRLTVKVVREQSTIATLVQSGEVDIAKVSGAAAERLEKAGFDSAEKLTVGRELVFNHESSPLADVEVRRALIATLDKTTVADIATGGDGGVANGLLADPKICPGDTVTDVSADFDQDAAQQMLDDAGWTKGADGVRTKGGKKLTVSVVYSNQDTTNAPAVEYITQQWQAIGVDAQANGMTQNQMDAIVFGGKGTWDGWYSVLGVSNPATLVPFMQGKTTPDGLNFASIDNADYNGLVEQAGAKDGADGCDLWNDAEKAIIRDADFTPLSTVPDRYFFGDKVKVELVNGLLLPMFITTS